MRWWGLHVCGPGSALPATIGLAEADMLQLWSALFAALPPSRPKARLGAIVTCLAPLQALSHSIS